MMIFNSEVPCIINKTYHNDMVTNSKQEYKQISYTVIAESNLEEYIQCCKEYNADVIYEALGPYFYKVLVD